MKKLFLITILFISYNLSAQEINWISFEEAVALQKKEPKKIIIDFYTKWCGPCKMLDKYTFSDPEVAAYVNENFYAVKFNAEGNEDVSFKERKFTNPGYMPERANTRNALHQLSSYFGIRAYPSIVFLDEKANKIDILTGYRTPAQLKSYFKKI